MGLREYNRKRDFTRTAEPRGKRVGAEEHLFVIQKHDATRLHYDFRLELDGVLKSWAVPKGPSLDPAQKRLAVEVEDHPVEYANFEGSIPAGEYGAGNVIVWDKGSWTPVGDPRQSLSKGRIEFELQGKKLHGGWILVRTRGDAAKPRWLLIKRYDRWAKALDEYDVVADESTSVLTGRELEARERAPKKAARRRARAEAFPDFAKAPFAYYLFDLLELNGEDLRRRPLVERKKRLKELLAAAGSERLLYSEHWPVPGKKVQAPPEPRSRKEPVPTERLHLTHPDKVLLPSAGLTKKDMVDYYAAVADWMLPHLVDRPLSLLRCPDGARKECFFQKSLGKARVSALYTQKITKRENKPGARTEGLMYLDSLAGLFSLVQLGVVEIHTWGTHRDHFMNPDLMIFDLDPGPGIEWKHLVQGARLLRGVLEKLGLTSFVKVSGSKGLHVHVPLDPVHSWDEVKEYSRTIARCLAEQEPERYVATVSKKEREGRIFIDYLRNGYGATAVAPFSLRAKEKGGVALPVGWRQLDRIEPNEFSVEKTIRTLRKRKKDPWSGYFDVKQRLNLNTGSAEESES